jgi:ABC-type multidrug transport system permease subunit
MRWLLGKDLVILRRSRLLLGVLIVYPIVVALLIGFAISRSPSKPRVAVANLTPPGESIELAGRRLSVGEYEHQLFEQIDVVRASSRAQAQRDVSSGSVLAAIVIPSDVVSKISSGVSQAQVEVIYNGDALQQSFVKSTIDAALAKANLALSRQIKDVAVHDIGLLLQGGQLGILGAPADAVGLDHLPAMLRSLAAAATTPAARAQLLKLASFASFASKGLSISKDVLATVSEPIEARETLLHAPRTPLDSFAVVVAVTISLMFFAVLLAAGTLALEREEQALQRLVRGRRGRPALLSVLQLVVEKTALSAVCAFVLSLAMLCAIGAFVSLHWARLPLWLAALALGAVAFAALGVAIGALAREVRAASLLAFLLSLPLAFLALVPSGAVAGGVDDAIVAISFVFPYKAALQALDAAVNGSSPGIALSLLHLFVLAVAFAALGRIGLRRLS